ncbi:MAG: LuxR C-terminal-related transcriptional regulator [Thermoleophilia bacterium]
MVVLHPSALGHLPSAIPVYRSALARMLGDHAATLEQARTAFATAREDQPLERGAAGGLLALAYWSNGDLDEAHAAWAGAIADLERAGHRADMLGGLLAMGDIRVAQGRLADARRTFERGVRLGMEGPAALGASGAGGAPLRGTADMLVGLAEVALEVGDLATARRHLDESAALGEGLGLPQHPWRRRVALAELAAAEGDADAALAHLDEAERVHDGDFFPELRPIGSVRARRWARGGRVAEAWAWVAERRITADDPATCLAEHPLVTLAEVLVADGRPDEATRLLDRLLTAAAAGGRGRSQVEILVVQSIAHAAAGDARTATAALEAALALAEAEGQVRVFTERAPAVTPLLAAAARRTTATSATSATARRMLALVTDRSSVVAAAPARPATATAPLIEPLSERELEVLRLLASDLDGPAMAAHLYISLNTFRTHTKNVFAKLGVTSRRAAVTRGTELGLVARR